VATEHILLALAVFLLAGTVKGLVGLGLPTITIALTSLVLPLSDTIALIALPIRGMIAAVVTGPIGLGPVQVLDGVGAGLLSHETPLSRRRASGRTTRPVRLPVARSR